jgi:hypothetical protein
VTALTLPGCASFPEAFAWLTKHAAGAEVLSVALYRGPDGLVRGSVLVRGVRQ